MKRTMQTIFLAGLFALAGSGAEAGVAVNVNIGVPPVVLAGPPYLVVVPGTYVYYAPDANADLVFYQGYWYRPYGGVWYRSARYDGRWAVASGKAVPVAVTNLPPNWKQVPSGQKRMPYGHVHQNWKRWEKDKHWDKAEHRGGGKEHGGKKQGGEAHNGKNQGRHREEGRAHEGRER